MELKIKRRRSNKSVSFSVMTRRRRRVSTTPPTSIERFSWPAWLKAIRHDLSEYISICRVTLSFGIVFIHLPLATEKYPALSIS